MNHQENGRDSAWLTAAFERLEGPLVGYAARLSGNLERGRDIVQDAFLRLCREPPDRQQNHVAAWLYAVCRNRALDVRKKEQRVKTLSANEAEIDRCEGADPTLAAERQDEAGRARAVLGQLPANQQEVIRLKVEHGLKYREISEVTGLSVSNVGYLLHRGLQTLRRHLSEQQVD